MGSKLHPPTVTMQPLLSEAAHPLQRDTCVVTDNEPDRDSEVKPKAIEDQTTSSSPSNPLDFDTLFQLGDSLKADAIAAGSLDAAGSSCGCACLTSSGTLGVERGPSREPHVCQLCGREREGEFSVCRRKEGMEGGTGGAEEDSVGAVEADTIGTVSGGEGEGQGEEGEGEWEEEKEEEEGEGEGEREKEGEGGEGAMAACKNSDLAADTAVHEEDDDRVHPMNRGLVSEIPSYYFTLGTYVLQ